MLDLIERYKWDIEFKPDGLVYITSYAAEFVVYRPRLRDALDAALTAQRKWSIG